MPCCIGKIYNFIPTRLAFAGLVLLISITAAAQSSYTADSLTEREPPDSAYVQEYLNKLHLRAKYGTQFMQFQTYFANRLRIVTRPNEVYPLTLGFSYRWLDLSYSYSPPFVSLNKDNALRGETRRKAYTAGFSFRRIMFYGEYSRSKGFYLANTRDFDSSWRRGDPFLKFPDLQINLLSASVSYCTNPRFSVPSIRGGDERQLRTAWTLLPGIYIQRYAFHENDSTPVGGKIYDTDNFDIHFTIPVVLNYVIKKQGYFSLGAGPAAGVSFFNSQALDAEQRPIETKGTRFSKGFLGRANLGYNGSKFFGGFEAMVTNFSHNSSNEKRLHKVSFMLQFFAGMRLAPPKFLKKSVQWVEKRFPILSVD